MNSRLCRRLLGIYLPLMLVAAFGVLPVVPQDAVARRRPNSSTASGDPARPDFKVDSAVVLIHVAITDDKGRFVTGLAKENFQVFEEKTEQEVKYFSAEEAPLSIGLVLDFSHSMSDKFNRLQEAVAQFLKTGNPKDEFCLVEFRDRAELAMGFTAAPEEIQNRVAFVKPKGSTALLDAVYLGLRQMKKAHNPRKALLIVSDGADNNSRFRARDVENLARESDVEIYAIGLVDWTPPQREEPEKPAGAALLGEITEQGGGRYYEVDNPGKLPAVAEKIGRELLHQYVLGYTPANLERDGKYRHVRVRIERAPGQPKYRASWRRGYYAPAD
ncbi:MAG TPA: VWA domain-containing protein [Bryobacteraceae bacterium]|nr:VWA domain-containing protein [Bryobacteraceae bacterium]